MLLRSRGNAKSFFSFQKYYFVLEFIWKLDELPSVGQVAMTELLHFQKHGVFRAGLGNNPVTSRLSPEHFLYVACTQLSRTGVELDEVESFADGSERIAMERRGEKSLQVFGQEVYALTVPITFTFHFKIHESLDNYRYHLVDTRHTLDLWSACHEGVQTDVEFHVDEQTFSAHRAVVAARSPVLAAILNNCTSIESLTGKVKVDDVEPIVFQQFLFFVYTGTLQTAPHGQQLLKLAQKYQVDTLIQLCQTATRPVDVEEVSTSLIWL